MRVESVTCGVCGDGLKPPLDACKTPKQTLIPCESDPPLLLLLLLLLATILMCWHLQKS
jgi:hypothetical protein